MYSSIYFCADGILRARNHDKPLIPLTFIQEYSDKKDDFSFWTTWWHNTVQFEKGLTLSGFFNCLEPWSEFFSTLTNVDIQTYINEMRKPCSIEKQSNFAYMEISTEHLFIPELKNLEKIDWSNLFDLQNKAKEKRLMALTGLWDINRRTSIHGYMNTEENKNQRYGFHLSHPESYANVPLVLNEIAHTSFLNYTLNRYFGEETPILNDLPYIITKNNDTVTIVSKKYFHFRELIESFFKELRKTPQDFRDLDKLLHERMTAYMERDKARAIEKEVEKADSNNVVSIHKKKDNSLSTTENNSDQKGIGFAMTPGFLSDLASLGAKDSEIWNYLVEEAAKKNIVLRIGKIESQEVPEIRIFGHIVSSENYIQQSEPKLL